MKDTFLILARHTVAALAGMLAHVGYHADANNTVALLGAVFALSLSVLWSMVLKLEMHDTTRQAMTKLGAALASQFIAAIAGWLQVDSVTVDDPAALLLFLGNLGASKLRGVPPSAKLGQWLMLALCLPLVSCSSTSQEALKQRLEAALVSAGREVSAVALESAITTLKHELALLEAKPVDEDPMQQLVDQNRIAAIMGAIRMGEARLKALRGGKAVIEVNPVSSVTSGNSFTTEGTEKHRGLKFSSAHVSKTSTFHAASHATNDNEPAFMVQSLKVNEGGGDVPSSHGSQYNPLRGGRSGISQSMPYHARPVKVLQASASPLIAESKLAGQLRGRVTIPAFAPQVVAHLSASH